jgi:hypothetical protein
MLLKALRWIHTVYALLCTSYASKKKKKKKKHKYESQTRLKKNFTLATKENHCIHLKVLGLIKCTKDPTASREPHGVSLLALRNWKEAFGRRDEVTTREEIGVTRGSDAARTVLPASTLLSSRGSVGKGR